jgi:hypothetical protein
MGLQRELAGWAAVPQSDGVRSGVRVGRPQASSGNSHGLLCRDRRVVGTEQRVRGGCDGQDHQLPSRRLRRLRLTRGHAFIDRQLYLPKA